MEDAPTQFIRRGRPSARGHKEVQYSEKTTMPVSRKTQDRVGTPKSKLCKTLSTSVYLPQPRYVPQPASSVKKAIAVDKNIAPEVSYLYKDPGRLEDREVRLQKKRKVVNAVQRPAVSVEIPPMPPTAHQPVTNLQLDDRLLKLLEDRAETIHEILNRIIVTQENCTAGIKLTGSYL